MRIQTPNNRSCSRTAAAAARFTVCRVAASPPVRRSKGVPRGLLRRASTRAARAHAPLYHPPSLLSRAHHSAAMALWWIIIAFALAVRTDAGILPFSTCEACVSSYGRTWCGNDQRCVDDQLPCVYYHGQSTSNYVGYTCQARLANDCPTKGQTSCGPPAPSSFTTCSACTSNGYTFCGTDGKCYDTFYRACNHNCLSRTPFECSTNAAPSCSSPNTALSSTPGQLPSIQTCFTCTQSGWAKYCFDSGSCTSIYAADCLQARCYAIGGNGPFGNMCTESTLNNCKALVGSSWGGGSSTASGASTASANAGSGSPTLDSVTLAVIIGGAVGGALLVCVALAVYYKWQAIHAAQVNAAQEGGANRDVTIRVPSTEPHA
jgi:hypothetical protein